MDTCSELQRGELTRISCRTSLTYHSSFENEDKILNRYMVISDFGGVAGLDSWKQALTAAADQCLRLLVCGKRSAIFEESWFCFVGSFTSLVRLDVVVGSGNARCEHREWLGTMGQDGLDKVLVKNRQTLRSLSLDVPFLIKVSTIEQLPLLEFLSLAFNSKGISKRLPSCWHRRGRLEWIRLHTLVVIWEEGCEVDVLFRFRQDEFPELRALSITFKSPYANGGCVEDYGRRLPLLSSMTIQSSFPVPGLKGKRFDDLEEIGLAVTSNDALVKALVGRSVALVCVYGAVSCGEELEDIFRLLLEAKTNRALSLESIVLVDIYADQVLCAAGVHNDSLLPCKSNEHLGDFAKKLLETGVVIFDTYHTVVGALSSRL